MYVFNINSHRNSSIFFKDANPRTNTKHTTLGSYEGEGGRKAGSRNEGGKRERTAAKKSADNMPLYLIFKRVKCKLCPGL